jgi:hypothetical protein
MLPSVSFNRQNLTLAHLTAAACRLRSYALACSRTCIHKAPPERHLSSLIPCGELR